MATPENKQETPKTPPAEVDRTVVMEDAQKATSGSRSGTHLSDVIDGAPGTIDQVNLEADPSPEFRRSLENTGKRYKILKMIAEGGFGKIFLAHDRVLGREVVIKSLKEEHL